MNEEEVKKLTPEEEAAEMEKAKQAAEEAQAALEKSIKDGTFENGFVQPIYDESAEVAEEPTEESPEGVNQEAEIKQAAKASAAKSKSK